MNPGKSRRALPIGNDEQVQHTKYQPLSARSHSLTEVLNVYYVVSISIWEVVVVGEYLALSTLGTLPLPSLLARIPTWNPRSTHTCSKEGRETLLQTW